MVQFKQTPETQACTVAGFPESIETPRLRLRIPVLSDASAFARQVSDPDIARMTATLPSPMLLPAAEFWVYRARASHRLRRAFPFAVILKQTGELIGILDIFNTNKYPEIGYWIGKSYWGKGYATEAGRAILAALAPPLGASIIQAGIYADNLGSGRVLEKLGFKKIGAAEPLFSVARGCKAEGWRYELRLESQSQQG